MDLVGAGLLEPPTVLPPDRWADEPAGWVPAEPSWQVTDLLPDPVQDPAVAAGREFGAEWPPPVLLDGTGPGPLLASLLTGSFVVENIFAIPGLGSAFVTSIQDRDYTVIMGVTLFYSALLIAFNVVVDGLYAVLDPRIGA